MITEAVVHDSNNVGSLRKSIWSYIYEKYKEKVDYAEFLIAIRRFINEGKMSNKDGFYSMHQAIITEFQKDAKMLSTSLKLGMQVDPATMKAIKIIQEGTASVVDTKKSVSSKKSKKSAIDTYKGGDVSVSKQSTIQKYFQRKQLDPFGFDNFDPHGHLVIQENGLGFATPGVEMPRSDLYGSLMSQKQSNQARNENILSQIEHSEQNPEYISKTVVHSQVDTKPFLVTDSQHAAEGIHAKRTVVSQKSAIKKTKQQALDGLLKPKVKKITKDKVVGNPKKTAFLERPSTKFEKTVVKENKGSAPNSLYQNTKDLLNDLKASTAAEVVEIPLTKKSVTGISKQSKPIKKVKKETKALKQLKLDVQKINKTRLRGKTLDLTQMGIIAKRAPKTPAPISSSSMIMKDLIKTEASKGRKTTTKKLAASMTKLPVALKKKKVQRKKAKAAPPRKQTKAKKPKVKPKKTKQVQIPDSKVSGRASARRAKEEAAKNITQIYNKRSAVPGK